MALTPSFCRGAARLLPIDGRAILGSSFLSSFSTNDHNKNGHGYLRRPPQYWPAAFAAFAATRAVYDARDDRARCMPTSQSSGAKGGRRSRFSRGEIVLDPDDPNDRAFDLIAKQGPNPKGKERHQCPCLLPGSLSAPPPAQAQSTAGGEGRAGGCQMPC